MGTFREGIIAYFYSNVRRYIAFLKFQHYAQPKNKAISRTIYHKDNRAPENRSPALIKHIGKLTIYIVKTLFRAYLFAIVSS